MAKLTGKALVAQGGGPTAVINQSVVGVVLEARRFPQITHVYGARHGVSGVLKEDFLDLSQATTQNLEDVAITPASGLGSTRDKPDVEYCQKMFKVMQAHDIRYFFYSGGNDSSDTCRIVNEQARATKLRPRLRARAQDHRQRPGRRTDHCPGFGSAAKFVAPGLRRRQHGQPRPARRLHRRGHGTPRRLPDRRGRSRPQVRGRRPAPHLPARAGVRRRQVRRRRAEGLRQVRPLHHRRLGRGQRQVRRAHHHHAQGRPRRTRTATCSSRAPALSATCSPI